MSLSEADKDLILKVAEEDGFRGFNQGKFYCYGTGLTSFKTLFNRMNWPESLKRDGLWHVFGEFKNKYMPEIVELFKECEHEVNNVEMPQEMKKALDYDRMSNYVGIVKDDIALFKTIRTDGVHDPGASSGISILAFNTKTKMLLNARKINMDGILTVKGIAREEVPEMKSIPYVWPEFNPYTPELTYEKKLQEFSDQVQLCLNTAIPPKWMTQASKDVKPGLSPFIAKLVNHLFPDEIDRELVFDWCHYAIFKRNGTVLCLAGERGTGKSTFLEILGELVGSQYTENVNKEILDEKFNAQFYNKRLIIFEEVALQDATSINKVKAWCNNKIAIEEKGKDAFSADNFTSMVFLINRLEELQVNAQERRFSIPVVASENFLTVASEKEIDDFKTKMAEGHQDSLDQVAAFGRFLETRKPKFSEHIPIKGANFNRVADLSLTEWQSHLRDYVQSYGTLGEIIPISIIFPMAKSSEKGESLKFPMKKSTIENFLRDYRYLGKHKIGDVIDMNEAEIAKFNNLQKGPMRPVAGSSRTRRMYGIKPREDFLLQCGLKYIKGEDLL